MNIFYALALLVTACAAFSYFNVKVLRLPSNIGLMLLSLVASLVLILLSRFWPALQTTLTTYVQSFDFSTVLMQYMLSFLLFAGSLHVDLRVLKEKKWEILAFTLVGVLMATFLIGYGLYWLAPVFGFPIPLTYCLLFGALISPTDPIAVLGILKDANVPHSEEVVITGESLFNDGIGVVLFLTILQVATGQEPVTAGGVGHILLLEVGGGLLLGFGLGYLGDQLLNRIDHYQTEVMLTLAIVMGGYTLAGLVHASGPLAMVVAGLYIGNYGRARSMSDTTRRYVDTFWELLDELLNATLFVFIGLELLTLENPLRYVGIGLVVLVLSLGVRYLSVALPFRVFGFERSLNRAFPLLMTWGGLKGGISIALALSLPTFEYKPLIITVTYGLVLFSVLVQGLTLGRVVRRLGLSEPE